MSNDTYTVVPCSNPAGWFTVLRNGLPIHHWPTQAEADAHALRGGYEPAARREVTP